MLKGKVNSQLSDNNKTLWTLKVALQELMKIQDEVKNDILLAEDEKVKTQFYLARPSMYLTNKKVKLNRPRKVLGSKDGTVKERLIKYVQWNEKINSIYNSIDWKVNLHYADIDMKLLRKLFLQLMQHMNSKIKYLKSEFVKLNTNADGQLVCIKTDKMHLKIRNLLSKLSKYIIRK